MGYEVRMIITSAPIESDDNSLYDVHMDSVNGLWVMVEADLWLGKLSYEGAYHKLLEKKDDRSYYFYSRDSPPEYEEFPVTHDPYGDPLQRLDPEEVLEALRKDANEWGGTNTLHVAVAMLEKFIERGPRFGDLQELIVLHYGY